MAPPRRGRRWVRGVGGFGATSGGEGEWTHRSTRCCSRAGCSPPAMIDDQPIADPREVQLPGGSVPTTSIGALEPGTRVITDLHLAPLGDERTALFEAACAELTDTPRLIILGDLFDVWVGRKQARLDGTARVLRALRQLTERGVAVELVPGNRDTLLGATFERSTGGRLHREGFLAESPCGLRTERIAFVHGDALCTLDRGYLRLRWLLRTRPVRFVSRFVPLWIARRVGERLRSESERRKPFKLEAERSIRPAAVELLAKGAGSDVVVCGHAHVARDVALRGVRWIVVAAWRESGADELSIGNAGVALDDTRLR